VLYICSETAKYRCAAEPRATRPSNPTGVKTKSGWRLFPPDQPKVWSVGEELGRAIRHAEAAAHVHHDGDRARPRPHVRRAHWHSYWTGPRASPEQRKPIVKWLPPIPVALEDDREENRAKRRKSDQPTTEGSPV
jgi:hypothetical protein